MLRERLAALLRKEPGACYEAHTEGRFTPEPPLVCDPGSKIQSNEADFQTPWSLSRSEDRRLDEITEKVRQGLDVTDEELNEGVRLGRKERCQRGE